MRRTRRERASSAATDRETLRHRWHLRSRGLLNFGLFFPLIFLSAYHLLGGLARAVAALVGLAGVGLLVLRTPDGVTALGLAAAFGSVAVSALGIVLVKRWHPPVPMLTVVSWQLVVGGLALLPVALLVEGPPPVLDLPAVLGLGWIAVVGTGVAYSCWYTALRAMPAGAVALVGLLNPVVGTVLGVAFAAEAFGPAQTWGMVLVLGGVLAGQLGPRGRRAAAAPTPAGGGESVGCPPPRSAAQDPQRRALVRAHPAASD